MTLARLTSALALAALLAVAAGCGTPSNNSTATLGSATTTGSSSVTTTAPVTTIASPAAGALTAEAQTAAAGDIPDNQVFLLFRSAAGYSVKYPEGWLQRGSRQNVAFQDKNNRIRIVVSSGPAFSAASVRADLAALKSATASFQSSSPAPISLPGGSAFKVTYSTESAPNPVTNKRVTLSVDRYYLSSAGKRAIIDLGAPKGVDNVDAFRLISHSFRWR